MRRLRALAALDPDFAAVIRARDDRRRSGVRVLIERLHADQSAGTAHTPDEQSDLLFTLIGFECFDTLAGPDRTLDDVVPLVQRLARAALLDTHTPAGH
jgi:hypothetical protein